MVDLLRFKKYAEENKSLKPIELIKGYNLKYPELTEEQKLKNSICNLFPMEPNYYDFIDDQIDMKQRLKAQLDELQEEVKSFYSDRSESPRSSFSKQNSPIKPVFSSFEKPKKQDDLKQLKQEVASWSSCIKEMQTSIEKLSKQLNSIEKNFQNRDYSNELQDFKEENIQEIKNMEFGYSFFNAVS